MIYLLNSEFHAKALFSRKFQNKLTKQWYISSQRIYCLIFCWVCIFFYSFRKDLEIILSILIIRKTCSTKEVRTYIWKVFQMKKLVETTYKMNGGKSVIFMSHSMGSIMTLYFLHSQPQVIEFKIGFWKIKAYFVNKDYLKRLLTFLNFCIS